MPATIAPFSRCGCASASRAGSRYWWAAGEQLSERGRAARPLLKRFIALRHGLAALRQGRRAGHRPVHAAVSARRRTPRCVARSSNVEATWTSSSLRTPKARRRATQPTRTFGRRHPYIDRRPGRRTRVEAPGPLRERRRGQPESGRSSDDVNPRPQEKEKEGAGATRPQAWASSCRRSSARCSWSAASAERGRYRTEFTRKH